MNWQATTLAAGDNVATVLQPIAAGETVSVRTAAGIVAITALEAVALCHKIAMADLPAGAAVIKYGQCIGRTTAPVPRGAWVHVHNLAMSDSRLSRMTVAAPPLGMSPSRSRSNGLEALVGNSSCKENTDKASKLPIAYILSSWAPPQMIQSCKPDFIK